MKQAGEERAVAASPPQTASDAAAMPEERAGHPAPSTDIDAGSGVGMKSMPSEIAGKIHHREYAIPVSALTDL
jgi:hypothetical protein